MSIPGYIADGDWESVRRVVGNLVTGMLDTAGRTMGLRFGSDTLTYTAAAVSAQKTISHGLSRTPTVIFANAKAGAKRHVVNAAGTIDSTSFDLIAETADGGVLSSTITVYWLVLG